jgi:hypothetical protein
MDNLRVINVYIVFAMPFVWGIVAVFFYEPTYLGLGIASAMASLATIYTLYVRVGNASVLVIFICVLCTLRTQISRSICISVSTTDVFASRNLQIRRVSERSVPSVRQAADAGEEGGVSRATVVR